MSKDEIRYDEKRQHERVSIRAEVAVDLKGRIEQMTAHNLSVGGAFLETTLHDHIDLKTGSRCALTLVVDENAPSHACDEGHTVHMVARVVRRDQGGPDRPSGLGVVFEKLDLENLVRLRALVSCLG